MKFLNLLPCYLQRKTISRAADLILKGHIVAGIKDVDNRTRLLQKYLIRQMGETPDFIVLSSSRAFFVRQRMFARGAMFFNHSFGGATLEDYIAVLGMYKKYRRALPARILFGPDPWVFNAGNGLDRWKYVAPFYNAFLTEMYGRKRIPELFPRLVDWLREQYITDETAPSTYYLKWKNLITYYVTEDDNTDDWLVFPDGSVHYPHLYRYTSKEYALKKAVVREDSRVFGLENYSHLTNTGLFEDLLCFLTGCGVEVNILLHPYHPISYQNFIHNPKYRIIVKLENYLRDLAISLNIQVLGSYDPGKFQFKNEDFFDKMHGYEHVTERIVNDVFR